ncbi:hypothetical protein GmHk_07G019044 [Glycine max]|nr:hypothetical protein GmHk_07G019044 [Glycine max]
MLSRGGYDFLEEKKLIEEKQKKRLEEASQSGSIDTVVDPPSPIRRHMKWKMTCLKKTGQMTSEVAKEIADRIASQGSFVSHGPQDVLIVVIGQPEHPGRVHDAGVSVTIKHYIGSASRGSLTSFSMPDAIAKSQGLALPPEADVGPSAAHVSIKESCVNPSMQDPEMGDSNKCGLVYEESTNVHNIRLGNDQLKVGFEEVQDVDAHVPVPTQEVQLVGQTLNTFLAWPTHLVKLSSEQFQHLLITNDESP